MIYQFDTDDQDQATAALLVYAVYRSRDRARFKVTPDLWGQIERFVKGSAKRATNVARLLESLKPRLACATIHPRWMEVGISGVIPRTNSAGQTEYIQMPGGREFLAGVLRDCDERRVVDLCYRETALIVLLVRDRLEREKPVESDLSTYAEPESL